MSDPGFLWGAASASHQVEGENTASDWWLFERQPGKAQNFDNFPDFARRYKADHWRRFQADLTRAKSDLGINAYRFSIEWSRVEPEAGHLDHEALATYAANCRHMRELGIEPLVTLFHWSSPQWIWGEHPENGGWHDGSIVERFGRYVDAVATALAPHARLFCTLNEPNVFAYGAFSEGVLAPGHKLPDAKVFEVYCNLLRCHSRAYQILKAAREDAMVGIAHNYSPVRAKNWWNPLERLLAAKADRQFSWAFPDAIHTGDLSFLTRTGRTLRQSFEGLRGTWDYSGVNFYETVHLRLPYGVWLPGTVVEAGLEGDRAIWPREIDTAGFEHVLRSVAERYGLPILITENGRAHTDDVERQRYLEAHVAKVQELCAAGVDIHGYFYWSLLDNQEWAHGFVPQFGLYAVDWNDGTRSLRGTGRRYAELIARGHSPRR